jgi:cytoskeletal protein CcmA (bactofilin family)
MFRRKEEGTADFNAALNPAGTVQSAASGASSNETQASTAAAAQSAAPASSYSPVSPVVRPLSDVTRSANTSAAYRSSPVAEFNRTASKSAQESSRSAGSSSSYSASDKHTTVTKPNPRILTVGNDILLKGEIATCDRVVIEGRVEAKLNDVHTVEIAGSGSFKGTAEVEDAEVSGLFEGDLAVRNRLVIYATGEVRGNVTYGEIEIARGGKLTGQIKTVSSSSEKPNLLDVLDKKARKEAVEG